MKEKSKESKFKNLIIAGIFPISIIIILLGSALIYNKFFYKKSYNEVEKIMLNAAQEYFNKYDEKLPLNINDSITITDETLIKSNYMDTILSYTKEKNVTCDGKVTVTNINGNYRYTSLLDCGNTYQTKYLTEQIKDNEQIVTEGNGLYNLNNELVYRGEYVNNYLKLSGRIYRIVKIKDGRPVIILTDTSDSVVWDNRYNIQTDNSTGFNDYEKSRMRTYLDNLYKAESEGALLTKTAKLLVTSHDLPIGRRVNADTDKTGTLENAKVLTNQYIGLLPISDFLNASTDVNCTETTSKSCINENYLSKYKYTWWTITANSNTTNKVYVVNGIAHTSTANSTAYIRPVLYLAKDTIYVSGNGTKNNPYLIK